MPAPRGSQFTIRNVDLTDTDNFMGSANMYDIAEKHGWWKKGTPLDFTACFSDGEYAHKFYSGRRMWGAYRRVVPWRIHNHWRAWLCVRERRECT